MERNEIIKAYGAWLSVCFFWGTTYLAIRIGVQNLPPALFAGIRWLTAGLIFVAALRIRGISFPAPGEYLNLTVVGISLLVIANGLVVWAEQWVPSGLTALIVATLPFWMAGFDSLMPSGSPMNMRKISGIILGFIGLLILFYPDLKGSLDRSYLLGVAVLFLAPISWSIGSLYSKYRPIASNPLMAAAVQMIIAGLLFILIGILADEAGRFHFSIPGFGAMAYLIIFGSIVGYGSYIYSLAKLPAAKVSLFAYVNPVIAVVLGWLILEERFDLYVIAASALVLFGVVMVKSSKH
ncbi:MAG: EamA family transporter [Thermodesulfobacteriota bacterium]